VKKRTHAYTTIQVEKEINKHIREFCKKYNVNASTITEMMWQNYISSSQYIKQVMAMDPIAKEYLLLASNFNGSLTGSIQENI
jgi:hypothetical protein